MEYFKFKVGSEIQRKYAKFLVKSQKELNKIYAITKPLGGIGLYRNRKEVLGVVFPSDMVLSKEWVVLKKTKDKLIAIPEYHKDRDNIMVKLKYNDNSLINMLFKEFSANYFGFVYTPECLMVETTAPLIHFEEYKSTADEFKEVCNTYKNQVKIGSN